MSRVFGPEEVLNCYRRGVFPMAEASDDPRLFLVDPDQRGVIPIHGFHLPKRLARVVKSDRFRVTADVAFTSVLSECARATLDRPNTWINAPIFNVYSALHRMGHAHSIETWNAQGDLVGGLYGVKLGAAFFGESMFSRETDASKVALVHLVARLKAGGFKLLDAQFITAHLKQFGAEEISRAEFRKRLAEALSVEADFLPPAYCGVAGSAGGAIVAGAAAVQLITQTS